MTQTPPNRRKTLVWAGALVALGAAIAFGAHVWGGVADGDEALPEEAAAPTRGRLVDFPCVERSGAAMRTADLHGRFVVADFMFTNCQGQCPKLEAKMKEVQDAAPGDDVRLVSITVDPDRDAAPVMAKYAEKLGADPTRWLFVRAAKDDVERLMVDELGVAKPHELILHSDQFILFDKAGAARASYRPLDEPEWRTRLLADLARLRGVAR